MVIDLKPMVASTMKRWSFSTRCQQIHTPVDTEEIYIHSLNLSHKSVLGPNTKGIAFISECKHKNSPITVIMATVMRLTAHHVNVVGNAELYKQHAVRWNRWAVAA